MNWVMKRLIGSVEDVRKVVRETAATHVPLLPNKCNAVLRMDDGAVAAGNTVNMPASLGGGSYMYYSSVMPSGSLKVGRNSVVLFCSFSMTDVTVGDNCVLMGVRVASRIQSSLTIGDGTTMLNVNISLDKRSRVRVGSDSVWVNSTFGFNSQPGPAVYSENKTSEMTIGRRSLLVYARLTTDAAVVRIGDDWFVDAVECLNEITPMFLKTCLDRWMTPLDCGPFRAVVGGCGLTFCTAKMGVMPMQLVFGDGVSFCGNMMINTVEGMFLGDGAMIKSMDKITSMCVIRGKISMRPYSKLIATPAANQTRTTGVSLFGNTAERRRPKSVNDLVIGTRSSLCMHWSRSLSDYEPAVVIPDNQRIES